MNRSGKNYGAYVLPGLVLLSYGLFALLQIPSSDDFCNKVKVELEGTLGATNSLYLNWTGRYVTSFLLMGLYDLLDVSWFNLISFLNFVMFGGALFFLTRLLSAPLLAFLCIFLLGARNEIAQYVFWPTGGVVYSFSYLVFFFSLWFILKKDRPVSHKLVPAFLTSLLVETINPAFLVFLIYHVKVNRLGFRRALILLLPFAVGSALLYFAPGNFARALGQGKGLSVLSVVSLFENYFFLLYKILRYLWPPMLLSALAAAVLAGRMTLESEILKARKVFLVAGLFSLSPFMLAVHNFNGRSSSFSLILFVTYGFLEFYFLFQSKNWSFPPRVSSALGACIASVLILLGAVDSYRMLDLRRVFLDRHELLKSSGGKQVNVEGLPKGPATSHVDDVRSDDSFWINVCVANHYGLKGIGANEN